METTTITAAQCGMLARARNEGGIGAHALTTNDYDTAFGLLGVGLLRMDSGNRDLLLLTAAGAEQLDRAATIPPRLVPLPLQAVDAAVNVAMRCGIFYPEPPGPERVNWYRGLVTEVINAYFDAGGLDPRGSEVAGPDAASWRIDLDENEVTVTGAFYQAGLAETVGFADWYRPRLAGTLQEVMDSPLYREWWPTNTVRTPVWQVRGEPGFTRAFRPTEPRPEWPAQEDWVPAGRVTVRLVDVAVLAVVAGAQPAGSGTSRADTTGV